jgi:hypothetical protein
MLLDDERLAGKVPEAEQFLQLEIRILNYRVLWEINIFDAGSPREASEKALEVQRRPNSIGTVFTVRDETDESEVVDLDDDSYAPDQDYSVPGGEQ